jgi:tetratricopeptide (TPR) repeat protein
MNEKPKSFWKKSWIGGRGLFLGWLFLMAALLIMLLIWLMVERIPVARSGDELRLFGGFAFAVTIIFLLATCIHWLCCWRNFKKFLFGLTCFATVIALFYAEEDWRGWHAWNSFKHKWEAKGEHFDMANVVPAPVPDDQNFAMTPIWVESMKATLGPERSKQWFGNKFAKNGRTNFTDRLAMNIYREGDSGNTNMTFGSWQKARLSDLKPWQDYYRNPKVDPHMRPNPAKQNPVVTNEFTVSPRPQTAAADVLLALGKYDSTIEELRQASRLTYSRFPLNYDSESPAAILLPQLAALKRCSQVLQLRTIAELQNGQPDKALDDVKLSLRLTDTIRTEPFFISHLVRIAMWQITLQPVYEGLAEHRWSDEQLVALDAELAKLDFLAAYQLSMDAELGCIDKEMDLVRRHPEALEGYSGEDEYGNNQRLPGHLIARLIPTGWFYQNQYRYARIMVEYYIPVADTNHGVFSPALLRRSDAVVTAEIKSTSPFNRLEKMVLPSLGHASTKFAYTQASVNLARTAIALERCRLAHGEYPESLDALAPQFIARVPHDVIGGQPLKYRRTQDGQFVLYSIGWNETDDGGVVGFKKGGTVDNNQGDWVWRYPAK